MGKVATPLILVNFKAYKEACGERAVALAKVCEKVTEDFGVEIAVAPQFFDLVKVREAVSIPVFSQHIDPVPKAGAFTGHVVAENLSELGIDGTVLNHSERKLSEEGVKKCIGIANSCGLVTVACADTPEEAERIAKFSPDFVAIEPPELIGTGVSVSRAKPEVVTRAVEKVKSVNESVRVLCGAGISSGEDVEKALELGAEGVLVASAVVKAEEPQKVLEEFAASAKKLRG